MTFEKKVKIHVNEIQNSTFNLKKLCKIYENDNQFACSITSQVISESIERLEYELNILQTCFDQTNLQNTKSTRFIMD